MTVLRTFADLKPVPWANGAGETTEIVSFEESVGLSQAGTAPWRLSIANLEQVGEFSPLPGVHRVFTPVGSALEMTVGGVAREVADGESLEFSGDDETVLTRLDRPCFAVNFMARVDAGGRVPTIRFSDRVPTDSTAVGALTVLAVLALEAGDGYEQFDLLDIADPPAAGAQAGGATLKRGRFALVTLGQ